MTLARVLSLSGSETTGLRRLVGVSPTIVRVRELIEQYAPTPLSILLVGPTGTGKELCARAIHELSGRKGQFVPVDCAALPRDLVEGELFGRRRGAYTDAVTDMKGLVAESHGGTLFLDELSSLRESSQEKLLRTLETGEVRRLGEECRRWVDLRLVAALQSPGDGQTRRLAVREALIHRLADVVLRLPALRERPEDIPILAAHFARERGAVLAESGLRPLVNHSWPGNVRELRAVMRRAAVLAAGRPLDSARLVEALQLGWMDEVTPAASQTARDRRRERLQSLLAEHNGDIGAIAESLGVSRSTVYRHRAELGIPGPRFFQALRPDC